MMILDTVVWYSISEALTKTIDGVGELHGRRAQS